ncbi:MAG: hypothetical protein ACRDTR_05330, partial [Rubrobacter sp.]
MIEDTIRQTATMRSPRRRTLLASLLALAVVLLTLSSGTVVAATTFTVNSTDDAADIEIADDECDSDPDNGEHCTLRAAIEEANDTAGADTIDFDIEEGTNPAKTIYPTSQLPPITDAVTIDGYTQADASPNGLSEGNDAVLNVQLDGQDAGAGAIGLVVEASDCTIRGLVIRRFDFDGIRITGAGATGNRVEGNFIGINRDGVTDRGNGGGVYVTSDSNTVGGPEPEMRNVISGNDESGVLISGDGTTGNAVEGNYVGTTADGTADLGNLFGVYVFDASDNTIGGTAEDTRNVVSGNDQSGLNIAGGDASGNRIEGNHVGTTADGSRALGNTAAGVSIQSADLTTVGGTTARVGNRIAHNGQDGVSIVNNDSAGNQVLSNRIYANGGLGIDLAGGTENANGVTANDTGDPDNGPNGLQNFPLISSATRSNSSGLTTISGKLNSDPSQDFTIQCFLTTNRTPASAYGEGSRLLA